jgi:hypothetical protein
VSALTVVTWITDIFKQPSLGVAKLSVFIIFSGLPLIGLAACAFNLGYLEGLGLRAGIVGFLSTVPLSISDAWHGSIAFATISFVGIATIFAVFFGGFSLLNPFSSYVSSKLGFENSVAAPSVDSITTPLQSIPVSSGHQLIVMVIELTVNAGLTCLLLLSLALIFQFAQLYAGLEFTRTFVISVLCFCGALGVQTKHSSHLILFGLQNALRVEQKWIRPFLNRIGLVLFIGTLSFGLGEVVAFERRLEPSNSFVSIKTKASSEGGGRDDSTPLARLSKGRLALEKDGRISFFDIDTEDMIYFQTAADRAERVSPNSLGQLICAVAPKLDGCVNGLTVMRYKKPA